MNVLTGLLSDQDLLGRLRDAEASFVERKPPGDLKDWLKTIVAFANSTPIGYPAVLFINATDDGSMRPLVDNFDTFQKKLAQQVEHIYPKPYYWTHQLTGTEGYGSLAVIVPGSESRPHSSGPSYMFVLAPKQ